jgi:hypothetical protein
MNHATAGCLGDGICTSDRVELIDQSTNMELGGALGPANHFGGHATSRYLQ